MQDEKSNKNRNIRIAVGIIGLLLVIKVLFSMCNGKPSNSISVKEFKLSESQLFEKQAETGDCFWLSGWGEAYNEAHNCGGFGFRFSDEILEVYNQQFLGIEWMSLCSSKQDYERYLKKYGAEIGKIKICVSINRTQYGNFYYFVEDLKFGW